MPAEDFEEWWNSITFFDEEGRDREGYETDFDDRLWAIEYAFAHDWDLVELLEHLYDEDFWEWWRENYE